MASADGVGASVCNSSVHDCGMGLVCLHEHKLHRALCVWPSAPLHQHKGSCPTCVHSVTDVASKALYCTGLDQRWESCKESSPDQMILCCFPCMVPYRAHGRVLTVEMVWFGHTTVKVLSALMAAMHLKPLPCSVSVEIDAVQAEGWLSAITWEYHGRLLDYCSIFFSFSSNWGKFVFILFTNKDHCSENNFTVSVVSVCLLNALFSEIMNNREHLQQ